MNMVALIPARASSKRVPGKNTRLLNGHPLIAYTIAAALGSRVFASICVCTDDDAVWMADLPSGCWSLHRREPVPDNQPDIVWIRDVLSGNSARYDAFAILRPTSPFRTAETIRRAHAQFFSECLSADSLRAIEPVTQNPYKMWTWERRGYPIKPLLPQGDGVPFHSQSSQCAPKVYIQNSSLEMSWTSNVEAHGSISGRKICAFLTHGYEGFSIDHESDWREAERIARESPDALPSVELARVSTASPAQ